MHFQCSEEIFSGGFHLPSSVGIISQAKIEMKIGLRPLRRQNRTHISVVEDALKNETVLFLNLIQLTSGTDAVWMDTVFDQRLGYVSHSISFRQAHP